MNEYLFSYGTLQTDKVQMDLFGRFLKGTKDILRGYRVSPIEITDEVFLAKGDGKHQKIAMISNNQNDFIGGMVFEVTEQELIHAGKYEPADYKRVKAKLQSGKNAWVYVAK
ncbi:MAG TPA: gamma-glutamylcyclotransferase family protein [Chitinophagaceae bacterium]|nr:gamma-glutamylcyclotransferase family protein [Chitinophagaceae bacterium]